MQGTSKPWRQIRLVRADELEAQFITLLGRLRASPDLVRRYRNRAAAPVSRSLLDRTLRELRVEMSELERKRERVFDLYLSGDVRREDVQGRLDAMASRRDGLSAQIATTDEQIAVAKAPADRDKNADALMRRAAQTLQRATEAEQRLIARAVALELGGLHVDGGSRLKVGHSQASAGGSP